MRLFFFLAVITFFPGYMPAQENIQVTQVILRGGYVYTAGNFTGRTAKFRDIELINADTTGNSPDVFVTQMSAATAKLQWAVRFGGKGHDECTALEGRKGVICIAGNFRSPHIQFGREIFVNADTSGSNADIFLVRLDSAGRVKWARCAGGTGNERVVSLAADSTGKLTLTGSTLSPYITLVPQTLQNPDPVMGLEYEALINPDGYCLSLVEKDADLKKLRKDFQEQFISCLSSNKIKISCAVCTGAAFDVEVTISLSGKMLTHTFKKEIACGSDAKEKMKNCLINYLQSLTFPPALFGKTIVLNASRVLKC